MRLVKDSKVETQTTLSRQKIPSRRLSTTSLTRGDILLDETTNMFYGVSNKGVPSPLGSRICATVNTGITPGGIAVTPDGKYVYVANNNNYGIAQRDSVTVIDVATNMPVTTIYDDSFDQPYTITMNSAGTLAYVTNSAAHTISIINIATNTVSFVIVGFDGPSGMVISSDGLTGYVNNYGSTPGVGSGNGTTVVLVNLLTNLITGSPITVDQAPAALAITPDGSLIYCINYTTGLDGAGTISVISTTTNTVVDTIPGLSGPFGIDITPDGLYAYVTNFGSNNFDPFGTSVSVVNLQNNTISATIEVGIQPSGVAVSPDGKYVYVSNYNTLYSDPINFTGLTAGQGTVCVIDTATNTVIPPTINTGQSPNSIVITPDGTLAYISNYTSNTVSVITL